jgi:hypothetical protein
MKKETAQRRFAIGAKGIECQRFCRPGYAIAVFRGSLHLGCPDHASPSTYQTRRHAEDMDASQ